MWWWFWLSPSIRENENIISSFFWDGESKLILHYWLLGWIKDWKQYRWCPLRGIPTAWAQPTQESWKILFWVILIIKRKKKPTWHIYNCMYQQKTVSVLTRCWWEPHCLLPYLHVLTATGNSYREAFVRCISDLVLYYPPLWCQVS